MKHFTTFKSVLAVGIFAWSAMSFGQKYTGLTASASDGTSPSIIFDGNTNGGRWQDANNVDDSYLIVDLGSVKEVDAIKIFWEGANAKDYNLSFSDDNNTYSGVKNYTNLAAGARIDVLSALGITCRYIKMQGVTRQLPYGYSIYEFEVYPTVAPALTSLTVTPANTKVALGATEQQLTANGFDQIGNLFALTGTTNWSVDGTAATVNTNGIFSSTQKGLYTVTATNKGISNSTTIEVLPSNANMAIGATATASSGTASLAIDGNNGTRWESTAGVDPQWILVDLGTIKSISDIIIAWEGASAKDYYIETSANNIDWTPLISQSGMANGARIDRMYDLNATAQYVRLTGTARTSAWGYSIWELKIYGAATIPTSTEVGKLKSATTIYPNPAKDFIAVSSTQSFSTAVIYNIVGQAVKSVNTISSGTAINISDLPLGNYIIQLTGENGQIETQHISKN